MSMIWNPVADIQFYCLCCNRMLKPEEVRIIYYRRKGRLMRRIEVMHRHDCVIMRIRKSDREVVYKAVGKKAELAIDIGIL